VERCLALIAGAGSLPALVARRARDEGWRVLVFAFAEPEPLTDLGEEVIPSRLTELGPVLARLQGDRVRAAVLCGRFAMARVLQAQAADEATRQVERLAGFRGDARLLGAAVATLNHLGVEVLDQRRFLGDLLLGPGCWTRRVPTEREWAEIHRGLEVARLVADQGVGQTVVLRHGAVTAVEAVEGTTEAIRRGTALGGPGAVIVKAVGRDHDYRMDTPAVGPETIEVAVAGRAAVLAVEAGRVILMEREAALRAADEAGLALVSVGDGG
jgi:DUF1009 family protein